MPSLDVGKDVVCEWIRNNFKPDAQIFDVGCCDGKWKYLLPEYPNMDGIDAWEPNCIHCQRMYRKTFHKNIAEFEYGNYDLIIFGDVIEHMDVPTAQKVLKYASERCKDMIVAVPFEYPQGELYGNPWERHLQADLTPKIFAERYPDLEVLHDTGARYCFYHKKQKKRRVKKSEKGNKSV